MQEKKNSGAIANRIAAIASGILEGGELTTETLFQELSREGMTFERDKVFFVREPNESNFSPDHMCGSKTDAKHLQAQTYFKVHIVESCVLVCIKKGPDPLDFLLLRAYMKYTKKRIAIRICTHADEPEPILIQRYRQGIPDDFLSTKYYAP